MKLKRITGGDIQEFEDNLNKAHSQLGWSVLWETYHEQPNYSLYSVLLIKDRHLVEKPKERGL